MAKSIKDIKEEFTNCPIDILEDKIDEYIEDERKGVQALIVSAEKRIEQRSIEEARLESILQYERECYDKGYEFVAGIDEVGRGPLAGPVVTAVVILPKNCKIEGVNDSKKVPEKKRLELDRIIKEKAIAYSIGVVDNETIDSINILQATFEAMRQALDKIEIKPDFILNDAVTIPNVNIPQKGIIGGDGKSISIGAASIIAKVYRDELMEEYDRKYPEYGFKKNKGYGSSAHLTAIRVHGITSIHRKTFLRKQADKETSNIKGMIGEEVAKKEMLKMGYEILDSNYRYGSGEVDIIAKKDGYMCFVEVKYRTSVENGAPCEAVNTDKQARIIEASQGFLMENNLNNVDVRFDVAEVLEQFGKKYFRYTENAFQVE